MELIGKIVDYDGSTDLVVTNSSRVVDLSGVQPYKILTNVSDLVLNVGDDGEYRASGFSFDLIDEIKTPGDVKLIFANNFIEGKEFILYDIDGNEIYTFNITSSTPGEKIVSIEASNNFAEFLEQEVPGDVISPDKFPDAPEETVGKVINYCFGMLESISSATGGGTISLAPANSIKCWRVDYTGTRKYLIGVFDANMRISALTTVEDPDGVDVSGSSSLVFSTINGIRYYFVNYASDVDYLLITYNIDNNTTAGVKPILDDIGDVFFNEYTFDTSNISDIVDYNQRGFNRVNTPFDAFRGLTSDRKIESSNQNKENLLHSIMNAYQLEYYVDKGKSIVFKGVDYANITADKRYQQKAIVNFTPTPKTTAKLINRIRANIGYYPADETLLNNNIFNHEYSQDKYNQIATGPLESEFRSNNIWEAGSIYGVQNFKNAKYRFYKFAFPWITTSIQMPLADGLLRKPLDIIKFPHPKAIDNGANDRHYHIRKITLGFNSDIATLGLRDIQYAYDMIDNRLHLKANRETGSNNFFNWGTRGNYPVYDFNGNGVTYSTAQAKFRTNSFLFNGTNQSISSEGFVTGDPDNFEILTFPNGDFIIGGWIYGVNDATTEHIMSFSLDANNRWFLSKTTTNAFRFRFTSASSNIINLTAGTFIPDTWQYVIAGRVASDVGLYVGGAQVAYVSDPSTNSVGKNTSTYHTGQDGASGNYFDGYMDDIIIDADNKRFSLAPVVGLTDTLAVPTEKLYEFPEGYVI